MFKSSSVDFTDREFWEKFFKERGGRPFEWYGEWNDLKELLAQHCDLVISRSPSPSILVPGCGNSQLSQHIYDSGFTHIVNIDFSKVAIAEMLRLHLRTRPHMLWRVMDMTDMTFPDDSFDIVLDKGGVDALLGTAEQETVSAVRFLSEVKRVLKLGGRYACITLAQMHVIVLLLSTFRHGWQVNIHQICQPSETVPSDLKPFLFVAKKEDPTLCSLVALSFDAALYTEYYKFQMGYLTAAIDEENRVRSIFIDKGQRWEQSETTATFDKVSPGQRINIILNAQGVSKSSYSAIVLDAPTNSGPFKYKCAVFLVQKGRAHEWLFSSEEGQWQVVESAKAGRLIMVFLDVNFYSGSMQDIQDDLSPLVKKLLPLDCKDGAGVPYLTSGDGVAKRTILEEIESPLTGPMLVEDVILWEQDNDKRQSNRKQEFFRRLVFRRNPNLIQSEASLLPYAIGEDRKAKHEGNRRHKSTKKKTHVERDRIYSEEKELRVDHSFLASPYHAGMIAGLSLISSNLEKWISSQELVTVAVVGLGAGLLPMFLHDHLPFSKIKVIELDPAVGDLAKRHFGFAEDNRLKLHIGDGISIVKELSKKNSKYRSLSESPELSSVQVDPSNGAKVIAKDIHPEKNFLNEQKKQFQVPNKQVSSETCGRQHISCDELSQKLESWDIKSKVFHVLLIDADSEDPSNGLSCPPPEFLEESFFHAAKAALHDGGMLVINLVSRAKLPHISVPARLKKVFVEVYDLEIDEDVNHVLFALPMESGIESKERLLAAANALERLGRNFASWGRGPTLKDLALKIRRS